MKIYRPNKFISYVIPLESVFNISPWKALTVASAMFVVGAEQVNINKPALPVFFQFQGRSQTGLNSGPTTTFQSQFILESFAWNVSLLTSELLQYSIFIFF